MSRQTTEAAANEAAACAVGIDAALAASGLPRAEALLLLSHASGWSRERLIASSNDPLPALVADRFAALAKRRAAGEPIAYLIGHREFYGRRFDVDARALIPRPETELLVDEALRWIDERAAATRTVRVLDLGTGSGAIAVTLALERPTTAVVATDRSDDALTLARQNAARMGARVGFRAGDWYDALEADGVASRFDLIVSNPPYVAAFDRHLDEGDLRFEPRQALTDDSDDGDDADGTTAIKRIVTGAAARLTGEGALMIEHGHDQARSVREAMDAAGFDAVRSVRDLAGIERVTLGRMAARPLPGGPPTDDAGPAAVL